MNNLPSKSSQYVPHGNPHGQSQVNITHQSTQMPQPQMNISWGQVRQDGTHTGTAGGVARYRTVLKEDGRTILVPETSSK